MLGACRYAFVKVVRLGMIPFACCSDTTLLNEGEIPNAGRLIKAIILIDTVLDPVVKRVGVATPWSPNLNGSYVIISSLVTCDGKPRHVQLEHLSTNRNGERNNKPASGR